MYYQIDQLFIVAVFKLAASSRTNCTLLTASGYKERIFSKNLANAQSYNDE